ncbi:F-box only protein 22-like protein [Dinothrombium tinctorium]|uniref:F-box only protein 22-like protein n=1 Tax=Dinothrombium tinctorium TaxID=1965070 RepID=A0A3S3Q7D4_9ACAR|nr:F-box only protein 22-like protein [Dinothrombium tinctorium]RWS04732.1 F-box only protein 22-like protein [Dinothrombium tinctorium]
MDLCIVFENVFSNELILKQILSKLHLKELTLCRHVCRQWYRLAVSEERKRLKIENWFFAFTRFKSYDWSSSNRKVCNNFAELLKAIRLYMSDFGFWIRPRYGFVFYGTDEAIWIHQLCDYNVFLKYVPQDCQLVFIHTPRGVVGSDSLGIPQEVETNKRAAISYMFTPKFMNDDKCGLTVFDEKDNLSQFDPKQSSDNRKLKALIVFTTSGVKKEACKNVENLVLKYSQLAVGGGAVGDVGLVNRQNSNILVNRKKLIGMAFYGEKVEAASIVLTTETEESTKDRLQQFKSNLNFDPDISNSLVETIGFIIISSFRSVKVYGKENVDSQLFHYIFPNVKLNGVLAVEEFGINYFPKTVIERELIKSRNNRWHAYSTVIVLVHLNKS